MTEREKFEAWTLTRTEYGAEFAFAAWQASRAAALEEAAKECDFMRTMWERQARGGDNTGASDFRADAAEQCAEVIRAHK